MNEKIIFFDRLPFTLEKLIEINVPFLWPLQNDSLSGDLIFVVVRFSIQQMRHAEVAP